MTQTLPYAGAAKPLESADITEAANRLSVTVPHIVALKTVETGAAGAFLPDGSGRLAALLEALHFSRRTLGKYDKVHPGISSQKWDRKLYLGGAAEYRRIDLAMSIDRTAALEATSWGGFQIMGFNHGACGFASAEDMVVAMAASERQQLLAFCGFIASNPTLHRALQAGDWRTVARIYNGEGFEANRYDTKLRSTFVAAGGTGAGAMDPMLANPTTLWIGSRGSQVELLQKALRRAGESIVADGIFGRATQEAVMRFQSARGLVADGVVGPATAARLGLS